jgi:hypothetical protein
MTERIRCMMCSETRPSGNRRRAKAFFVNNDPSQHGGRKLVPVCGGCRDGAKGAWPIAKLRKHYNEYVVQELMLK